MSRSNGQGLPPVGVSTRPPRQLNQPSSHQQPSASGAGDQLSQFRQSQQRPQPYAPQYDPYAQPQNSYPQSGQSAAYNQQPSSYGQQPTPYGQPSLEQLTSPLSQPSSYSQPQQSYGAAPQSSSYGASPQSSYGGAPQTTSYGGISQAARTQVPSFEQWSTPAAQPPADTRSYDHGGYASPSLDPYQPHGQHAQHGYANPQTQQQPVHEWGQAAQQFTQSGGLDTTLDPSPYAADQAAYQQPSMQDHGAEFHDEEDYEQAAPRGKYLRIAAALVGAIIVGGGLAYAYTSLIAPGNGELPVIKSASGPNKIKPADAGGKKFANGEKKLMGQLNDGASSSEGDVSGVKRVGTVQVAADGSIIPPAEKPVEAAPERPLEADSGFPSTGATLAPAAASPQTVSGLSTPTDQTLTPASPRAPDSVVQVATNTHPEAAKPAVAAASPITTAAVVPKSAAEPAVAAPAPPPVKKVAVAPPTVKSPAAAATASPTGAAGYVAVLASVPVSTTSRINALKQFADMQQKFGTVLQNKTPDVREANLGEKGNYHRLLVGPPGSREGAQALCGSLKAAGYPSDCWVTAY